MQGYQSAASIFGSSKFHGFFLSLRIVFASVSGDSQEDAEAKIRVKQEVKDEAETKIRVKREIIEDAEHSSVAAVATQPKKMARTRTRR